MKLTIAVAFALILPGVTHAQETELEVTDLMPSVRLVRGGPNGNVLLWRTGRGTLMVDAQSTALGGALRDLVTSLGDSVRFVVNTHYHEDHIGGNPMFRAAGAVTIGHGNVAVQARKDTVIEIMEWHREAASPDAIPSVSVSSDTTLRLDGRAVELLYLPAAHTDGDLAVWVPELDLMHTGDVLELDAYPFIDMWAGGTIDGMIAAVDRLLRMVADRSVIVPGHGPPANRATLVTYREMLVTVRDGVQAALSAGKTMEETMDLALTEPFDVRHGGQRRGRRFVAIVYLALGGTP